MKGKYILTYDLGTTGNKAALYDLRLNLLHQTRVDYPLYYPKLGWVEQDPGDYWKSFIKTTSNLIQQNNINSEDILGIILGCQMNCTVPIDSEGNSLMNCINWLDTRAAETIRKHTKGLIKISGIGLKKLLMFLKTTSGAPGINGKDPISHILWIKENEPEIYKRTFKFLSVKDYIIYKCTNIAVTSRDLGHTSWLMNTDPNIFDWSVKILKKFKIDKEKLPNIKKSTEIAGELTNKAAQELGLRSSIPIFVGSGDIIASAIGSGALNEQIIICLGTSDWVAAHTSERVKDLIHYTGPISSVDNNYLCISKQETGTACLDWILNQMFKDEMERDKDNPEKIYQYLDEIVEKAKVGSQNLIFTPWMFGERSPLNNPNVRGGFYNLGLYHDRSNLLRAVYEGVAFNIKWALTVVEKLIGKSESINLIGGGAKSNVWCQIISDVLERDINQMENPNLVAVRGSAIIGLVGSGVLKDFSKANSLIKIKNKFTPNSNNKRIYDKLFTEFLNIYKNNKKMFKNLNLLNKL